MRRVNIALLATFLIALPLSQSLFPMGDNYGSALIALSFITMVLCVNLCYCILEKSSICFKITIIDLIFFTNIIYIFIRTIFSINKPSPIFLSQISCGMLFYVYIRLLNSYRLGHQIVIVLTISGLIQGGIGIAQSFSILPSRHIYFNITGSFENPGILAAYLVPLIVLSYFICIPRPNSSKAVNWVCTVPFFVMLIVACATMTRACIISLAVVLLLYKRNIIRDFIMNHKSLSIIIAITGLSICVILFIFKYNSSISRIFIWIISIFAFFNGNVIFGNGYESFSMTYIKNQIAFLQNHPSSIFMELADNVHVCYNDFLQYNIEYGIVGGILIIGLLYYSLIINSSTRFITGLKLSLIAILLVSLFSYPFSNFSIVTVNIALISLLSAKSKVYRTLKIPKLVAKITIPLSLITIIGIINLIISMYCSLRHWEMSIRELRNMNYGKCVTLIEKGKKLFYSDRKYLSFYGKSLSLYNDYVRSNMMLQKANLRYPTSFSYIAIGDNYKELNDSDSAEHSYLIAYWISPQKIYPQYKLAMLYYDNKDYDKFKITVQKTLLKDDRILTPASIQLRDELREKLNKLKTDEPKDF